MMEGARGGGFNCIRSGTVARSCEHGRETSASIECLEFFEEL